MNQIQEKNIKQWSLSFSDIISTKFKLNIECKDLLIEEKIYSEFYQDRTPPNWTTLFKKKDSNHQIICLVSYKSIIATTSYLFSHQQKKEIEEKKELSFTETFIAKYISNEMLHAFESNELNISYIRSENALNFVHSFHDDEKITIYKFNWIIDNLHFGELKVCHTHML